MRRVTWRSWALLAAGLAVYAGLGWWWSGNGNVEMWVYRIGLTAASVMPLVFSGVYAARARWWRWEYGAVLVRALLAMVPTAGPLAWAFWFDGGQLRSSWLAWLAVSGPALSALMLADACRVWLQAPGYRKREETGDGAS